MPDPQRALKRVRELDHTSATEDINMLATQILVLDGALSKLAARLTAVEHQLRQIQQAVKDLQARQ